MNGVGESSLPTGEKGSRPPFSKSLPRIDQTESSVPKTPTTTLQRFSWGVNLSLQWGSSSLLTPRPPTTDGRTYTYKDLVYPGVSTRIQRRPCTPVSSDLKGPKLDHKTPSGLCPSRLPLRDPSLPGTEIPFS